MQNFSILTSDAACYFLFNIKKMDSGDLLDDANAYRERLKVLRMRAGLDNNSNTESKVCRKTFTYSVQCKIFRY